MLFVRMALLAYTERSYKTKARLELRALKLRKLKENEMTRKKQIWLFDWKKRRKKLFHYWNLCTIYRSHSFISRNNVEFYERFCFSCFRRATQRRSHELCSGGGGSKRDNRTTRKAMWKEKQILSHFLAQIKGKLLTKSFLVERKVETSIYVSHWWEATRGERQKQKIWRNIWRVISYLGGRQENIYENKNMSIYLCHNSHSINCLLMPRFFLRRLKKFNWHPIEGNNESLLGKY